MIECRDITVYRGFVYMMNDVGDVFQIGMMSSGIGQPEIQEVSRGTGRWPFHLPPDEVKARIEGTR